MLGVSRSSVLLKILIQAEVSGDWLKKKAEAASQGPGDPGGDPQSVKGSKQGGVPQPWHFETIILQLFGDLVRGGRVYGEGGQVRSYWGGFRKRVLIA